MNYLPAFMWDDYEIVSSIWDFFYVSERLKKDETLKLKLFRKNVLFYRFFNEANRRKHMYDILDERVDLRCVIELITMSTNDLRE